MLLTEEADLNENPFRSLKTSQLPITLQEKQSLPSFRYVAADEELDGPRCCHDGCNASRARTVNARIFSLKDGSVAFRYRVFSCAEHPHENDKRFDSAQISAIPATEEIFLHADIFALHCIARKSSSTNDGVAYDQTLMLLRTKGVDASEFVSKDLFRKTWIRALSARVRPQILCPCKVSLSEFDHIHSFASDEYCSPLSVSCSFELELDLL